MSIYPPKLYLKYLPNLVLLLSSLILNIFTWLWLLIQIPHLADPIFLHYNILFGVDYVDDWWKILYLPLVGLLILVVNCLIGWWFFGRDKFVAQFLNFISLLCQIFIIVGASFLIFLNV